MQENKREIQQLLTNIKKGLRFLSVKQMSEAISKAEAKTDNKNQDVEIALELVCVEFGISKRTLLKSTARGHIQEAKRTAYCLLSINLGLSVRYTAKKIFSISHGVVQQAVTYCRGLNENIKPDREFKERYIKLSQKLLEATKK